MVHRHGARAPYTNSDNVDMLGEVWKEGSHKITNLGIRQQYLLGIHDREKYKDFLSEIYSSKEVSAISSNSNRAIVSANAHLMGLFNKQIETNFTERQKKFYNPPLKDEIDLNDLNKVFNNLDKTFSPNNMQIMAVHVLREKHRLDKFKNECPYAIQVFENNLKLDEIVNNALIFNATFGEELCKILNISHPQSKKYFLNHRNIQLFSDAIVNGLIHDKSFDIFKNANINIFNLLHYAYETLKLDNFYYFAGDKELSLAYSTSLLKEIVHYMRHRVKKDIRLGIKNDSYTELNPKMVIYSLHDYDVSSMLETIQNIFGVKLASLYPSYSSSMNFELSFLGEDLNNLNENDFEVKASFNGNFVFVLKFREFAERLDEKLFSDEKLKEYCYRGFDKEKLNEDVYDENNNVINYQFYFMTIFSILAILELLIIIRFKRKEAIFQQNEKYYKQLSDNSLAKSNN
jgi:hypothetical protein